MPADALRVHADHSLPLSTEQSGLQPQVPNKISIRLPKVYRKEPFSLQTSDVPPRLNRSHSRNWASDAHGR
jgi:hypothetical protein